MKPGEATIPDDVAGELWNSRHWNSAEWLTAFFNEVVEEKKTPVDWQRSTTIPIRKRKRNPADCANYRPIRLLSHNMKIFERIINRRVRDIIRDLEKAFDSVPHEAIWYALRWRGVPEKLRMGQVPLCRPKGSNPSDREYVGRIPNLRGRASRVSPLIAPLHPCHGRYNKRPAEAGTMDSANANDVMLASEQKEDLERQTQAWSERLAQFGLRFNVKKTKYMTTNLDEPSTIQVDGNDLRRTDYFEYLGSTLSAEGTLAHEVVTRVNAAWLKWRSKTGVLCDKISRIGSSQRYIEQSFDPWHSMVQNAGQPPRK
ncbi:hypothetical protein Y032_0071g586 [Ancylostoma ceylanicum]|uniref:Reverse transcriptase domain-containing protein n=1 Tax=Ancylostoma ceylanicum TaxID=53326 RepID=A0A016TWZ8_9BILA|nr:hypothetical protein Y032_0071g586 [Ancylostoma ceylanicum]